MDKGLHVRRGVDDGCRACEQHGTVLSLDRQPL
jgi:hypothetical protein